MRPFFVGKMSAERPYLDELELTENMQVYDYLIRHKIDSDIMFDRENHTVHLFDVIGDDFPEEKDDQLAMGTITRSFPQMPSGELHDDAELLLDTIEDTRNTLLTEMLANIDDFFPEEIEQVENFEISHLADYAKSVSEKRLEMVKKRDISAEDAYRQDALCLYWLRVKTIATAALIISGEREEALD